MLEIFTHPEHEGLITQYSAQVGCLQRKETNPATFNITLHSTHVHTCVCVYACTLVIIVSSLYVQMSDHFWVIFIYSIVSFQLVCVCLCVHAYVCYFVLCVLRVWVFPLLETQFELNSFLSWASGCSFKMTALHSELIRIFVLYLVL